VIDTQRTSPSGAASTATAVDQVCSIDLQRERSSINISFPIDARDLSSIGRRNELDPQVPRLQQTAADKVCKAQSSSDKQELPSISAASTATAAAQVCKLRRHHVFPSFKPYPLWTLHRFQPYPLCGKSSPPSTTLLFNQSLQLHPSFYRLLPTATPYTTLGISGPTVKPKDYLLIQPRTVDCPYIYPYSIPKYFLQ